MKQKEKKITSWNNQMKHVERSPKICFIFVFLDFSSSLCTKIEQTHTHTHPEWVSQVILKCKNSNKKKIFFFRENFHICNERINCLNRKILIFLFQIKCTIAFAYTTQRIYFVVNIFGNQKTLSISQQITM